MRTGVRRACALVGIWMSVAAAADPNECLKCHAAEEFEGLSPAAILEVLADPGIPPHRKFAELSEEEVAALLDSE